MKPHSLHYESGELYMVYKRGACGEKGDLCEYCQQNEWKGPVMSRIPRPFPDHQRLPEHHYKPLSSTPVTDEHGHPRKPDDYQPRANMKILFDEGKLSEPREFKEFSDNYVVGLQYIISYHQHLKQKKQLKEL